MSNGFTEFENKSKDTVTFEIGGHEFIVPPGKPASIPNGYACKRPPSNPRNKWLPSVIENLAPQMKPIGALPKYVPPPKKGQILNPDEFVGAPNPPGVAEILARKAERASE